MTNKYGAKKTEIDGYLFDSKHEADRYSELKLLEYAGEIEKLEMQPVFPIIINNIPIAVYIADFKYIENGKVVIEDAKSDATRKIAVYRLKKKIVEAMYSIKIMES